MSMLRVRQTRSPIGGKRNQRETLRSLGLKRIGEVVVKEDRPEIRGMVATVAHLVAMEVSEQVEVSEQEVSEQEVSEQVVAGEHVAVTGQEGG